MTPVEALFLVGLPGRRARGVPALCCMLFLFLFLPRTALSFPLEIPGTGACGPVLRKLAGAFNDRYPAHDVSVPPSTGSSGGIRAVLEGEAVLARVARPIREEEADAGLAYRVFASDAVVFAAGSDAGVDNLSGEQLAAIFRGDIRRWDQVGGARAPVFVLRREEGDSSLRVIRKHVRGFRDISFTGGAKVLYHDYEMVEMLRKYRTAIGWLTRSSLEGTGVRPLGLNGVMPTPGNLRSGRYWLSVDYAFVYREGGLTREARAFMDFVMYGPGRRMLEDSGLVVPKVP